MATGISISSTSNLSSGQKIMMASAMEANEPAAPDPDLVESVNMPKGHKEYDLSTYARFADASALLEGVDVGDSQQLVTNVMTITPSEHGAIATVSKRLIRRQGDSDVLSVTGRLLGASLRRKQAKDIIVLYDGFSKSIVGAGAALDSTYFRGSYAYLRTDQSSAYGPAPLPLIAALHVEQISDIVLDLTDTTGTSAGTSGIMGMGVDIQREWWRGRDRLYSIQVFESGNIALDASDDVKGAIFGKDALFLVVAESAEPVRERDESLRAIEVGIFQEWGEAERADSHGVEVYSDALTTV